MDYQGLIERLKRIILPVLEDAGIELVELDFIRAKGRPMLKLLVDKIEGRINLDECAQLNQRIGSVLDVENVIESGYILEVSSPGLDRPLKSESDFLRCLNKTVRLFLAEPVNGKIELAGVIEKVEEDAVYIKIDEVPVRIPLIKINKAKQIIDKYYRIGD